MIAKGQIYETNADIPIICMTSWRAPFTGGYDRILKKGERFKVSDNPGEKATAVYCEPLRYKGLHKQMVPLRDRMRFWVYAGYYFCIKLETITNYCKLVEA